MNSACDAYPDCEGLKYEDEGNCSKSRSEKPGAMRCSHDKDSLFLKALSGNVDPIRIARYFGTPCFPSTFQVCRPIGSGA